jgi:calcium/calmodulin-dependent protein kinase I
MDLMEGGELFD